MFAINLVASTILGVSANSPQIPSRDPHPTLQKTVVVGWNDEMDARSHWGPLSMENKAFVAVPESGKVFLGLDQVPVGWPYQFQWSGVTQDAQVDVSRFPILMARVPQVQGYAHMDIDVIGTNGEVVNTIRSSTLTTPGISSVDLHASLPPATYHLRLRLIVGGPNTGCCATYDWVRFVNKGDSQFLDKHPDWSNVRRFGIIYR